MRRVKIKKMRHKMRWDDPAVSYSQLNDTKPK
jgi:hypothetical protein